jgi:predicted Zn-ribbon and HTH transcriptional regulator
MPEAVACATCGAEVNISAAFCHYCGTRLERAPVKAEKVCLTCGSGWVEGAEFCYKCGKPFPKSKKFCTACGAPVVPLKDWVTDTIYLGSTMAYERFIQFNRDVIDVLDVQSNRRGFIRHGGEYTITFRRHPLTHRNGQVLTINKNTCRRCIQPRNIT